MNPSKDPASLTSSEETCSTESLVTPAKAGLALVVEKARFGICRLPPKARIPRWVHRSSFFTISRSRDELSIVCEQHLMPEGEVPEDVRVERGWRAIRVLEPLDLSLIGVLASLARPLTEAGVSIFCISTYDTDYLLVRHTNLERAITALEGAGHRFEKDRFEKDPIEPSAGDNASGNGDRRRAAPLSPARETEPQSAAQPTHTAKDRVARALADLSTALKAPWRARTDEAPVKAATAESVEPAEPAVLVPAPESDDEDEITIDKDTASEVQDEASARSEKQAEPSARAPRSLASTAPKDDLDTDEDTGTAEVEVVFDWDAEEDDGEVRAEGLFTGAIPQGDVEVTDQSFGHLGLSNPILETIHSVGFEHPTPIQAQVIPEALNGRDIIGLAETGSGKTAAFCLPMAERLTHGRGLRGLILCPTREIALQTKAFLEIFGRDHQLKTVEVIGGVRMGPQIQGFRNDPDILVATPGRLADHLRRRNVSLKYLEELVLDEADHMLDLGFLPQIKEILQQAPQQRRTMMFSATMPPPIERLAQMFMQNPFRVDIRPTGHVAEGIEHRLYLVRDEEMKTCLLKLLEVVPGSTLVFSRRKLYTEWLARQMEQEGLKVARIHSDRSQSQRVQALRGFREGKYRILVATDVAARGLDVPRIEHVINYGLPETTEAYIHRAGRTARGNAVGIVSSIGTWQDKVMVREIEHTLGITIPRCELEGVEPYKELPKRKGFRRRRLL